MVHHVTAAVANNLNGESASDIGIAETVKRELDSSFSEYDDNGGIETLSYTYSGSAQLPYFNKLTVQFFK